MWIFPWISFSDTLTLCETNLEYAIGSSNNSAMGYLHLIWSNSGALIVGLEIGFLLCDLFLENSEDSYICFCMAFLHLVSYLFLALLITVPSLYAKVLMLFHLTFLATATWLPHSQLWATFDGEFSLTWC